MSNDDEPDVQTIEVALSLRVDRMKRDKDILATCPGVLERLSQYVKDGGSEKKKKWCPDCYITKTPEDRSNPYLEQLLPRGKNALYKCGKCGLEIEALRQNG